ncbi:enoyl-CoA hydratase-related protein [Microbacterium sp.]|uniref:enoyl-CoA hydratase-related protein n=1 Tax=Microbacterium sp. TaxID=51671 RepID=UPI0037CC7A49
MSDDVLFEIEDGIATITLNRPEKLNAANVGMLTRIIDLFDRTDADDDVRAVIVTGSGRAFCAGADLDSAGSPFDASGADYESSGRDLGGEVTLRVFRSLKPVIAAINGPAVGFGASFVLPMDIRLLADSAKVGFVFGARGVVPDGAASWFLPRIVGLPRALEWSLTARLLTAEQALAGGLVSGVHPPAELLAAARAIAREISTNVAPVSAALTRQMMWRMAGAAHPMEAHIVDSAAIRHTGSAPDAVEGVRAFLEKRPATWSMAPSRDLPAWFPFQEPAFTAIDEEGQPPA